MTVEFGEFSFLEEKWSGLYLCVRDAIELSSDYKRASAVLLRLFSEEIVNLLLESLDLSEWRKEELNGKLLVLEQSERIPQEILTKFHAIRRMGNYGAHYLGVDFETRNIDDLLVDVLSIARWFDAFSDPDQDVLREDYKSGDVESGIESYSIDDRSVSAFKNLPDEFKTVKTRTSLKDSFDFYLNKDQLECVTALEAFLNGTEDQVFILKGGARTGSSLLMNSVIDYMKGQSRRYRYISLSRFASRSLESPGEGVSILASLIYDFSEGAWFDPSDEVFQIGTIGQNQDPDDIVYIVENACLISDVSKAFFFRTGSDKLLTDFIRYTGIEREGTSKRIIFIGDPILTDDISKSAESALDATYLRKTFGLNVTSWALDAGVGKSASNFKLVRDGILSGHFDSSELIPDANFGCLNNKDLAIEKSWGELGSGEDGAVVLVGSDEAAHTWNELVRTKLFNGKRTVAEGDIVVSNRTVFHEGEFIPKGERFVVRSFARNVEKRSVSVDCSSIDGDAKFSKSIELVFRDFELKRSFGNGQGSVLCVKVLDQCLYAIDKADKILIKKAIIQDFFNRRKDLDVRKSSRDLAKAMIWDPYLNVFCMNFGYAMTQDLCVGGRWNDVIVDLAGIDEPLVCLYSLYHAVTRSSARVKVLNLSELVLRPGDVVSDRDRAIRKTIDDFLKRDSNHIVKDDPTVIKDLVRSSSRQEELDSRVLYEEEGLTSVKWLDGNIGDILQLPTGDLRRIYIKKEGYVLERVMPVDDRLVAGRLFGEAVRVFVEDVDESEKQGRILKIAARPKGVQLDVFDEELGIVGGRLSRSNIYIVITDREKNSFCEESLLQEGLDIGDSVAVKIAVHFSGSEMKKRVVSARRSQEEPDGLMERFSGSLTLAKGGYGFVDCRIFVARPMIERTGLQNNDKVSGVAVINYDAMKKTWGMKAVKIDRLIP